MFAAEILMLDMLLRNALPLKSTDTPPPEPALATASQDQTASESHPNTHKCSRAHAVGSTRAAGNAKKASSRTQ
jgi:hypothetical protein